MNAADSISQPIHYISHPSGIEIIELTQHLSFNLGNIIKYVTRRGLKGNELEDLKKARQYAKFEKQRIEDNGIKPDEMYVCTKERADTLFRFLSAEPEAWVQDVVRLATLVPYSNTSVVDLISIISKLDHEISRLEAGCE